MNDVNVEKIYVTRVNAWRGKGCSVAFQKVRPEFNKLVNSTAANVAFFLNKNLIIFRYLLLVRIL